MSRELLGFKVKGIATTTCDYCGRIFGFDYVDYTSTIHNCDIVCPYCSFENENIKIDNVKIWKED